MEKGRSLVRWTGIGLAFLLIAITGMRVQGVEAPYKEPEGLRADILVIDTLKVFGELERPAVLFLHDQHTDALEKQEKGCKTCHLKDASFTLIPDTLDEAIRRIDPLSPKFKRLKDESRQEVMDIYHDECIGCHTRTADEGYESGPVTCGECHQKEPEVVSVRQEMGMDLSLHYRHVKAQEKKCGVCHHKFDEIKDQLFYAKGEEGSCRYCHREVKEENRISMRLASHVACVNCHRDMVDQQKETGPIRCAGCHSEKMQARIKKVDPLPRMERNQPDAVFVNITETAEISADMEARMAAVPFDHKAHETYNDTCRVCHHEGMETCSTCHTLAVAPDAGKKVNLEQAMHQENTNTSCIGCHMMEQAPKECAGCHNFMPKDRKQDDAFCKVCHSVAPSQAAAADKDEESQKAANVLEARKTRMDPIPESEIPETVTIKAIEKEFEPAIMPHRKIIDSLQKGVASSKLANHFHTDRATLCQGCHHNTPPAVKPPKCSNCHGKPFDEKKPIMPGLKAAYHRQCMECHKNMGIEKPAAVDCAACHKEKKK